MRSRRGRRTLQPAEVGSSPAPSHGPVSMIRRVSRPSCPVARTEDVYTEQVDTEILLFDGRRAVFFQLNRTAALVWQNADGTRTVTDLVEILRHEVGDLADEDLVLVSLDRLKEQDLLESGYEPREPEEARFSRRRWIQRTLLAGTAAMAALPVVTGMVAPTPAAASSTK